MARAMEFGEEPMREAQFYNFDIIMAHIMEFIMKPMCRALSYILEYLDSCHGIHKGTHAWSILL